MIITINEQYRLVSDPLQWMVQYRPAETTKEGKPAEYRYRLPRHARERCIVAPATACA